MASAWPALHDYLGLTIEQRGTPSRVTMPITEAVRGGVAPVHGGALATLIDVSCAVAIDQDSYDHDLAIPVSTDLLVRFLRQPKESPLIAQGSVVHAGSLMLSIECVVTDGAGRQVARGGGTYMLLAFGSMRRSGSASEPTTVSAIRV